MNHALPSGPAPEYFILRHASGQALLSEGQTLLIAPVHEMALLIDWYKQRLVAACTFFDEELTVLLPTLRAWPGYVPYPRLLALLETGQMLDPEQEAATAQRYQEALDTGTQNALLAPLRARLADPQRKLALFGLRLGAVYQTGLLLMQAPRKLEQP